MPQANALNSIGYTDTVSFLTIGKQDIYLHKSLGTVSRQQFLSEWPIITKIGYPLT